MQPAIAVIKVCARTLESVEGAEFSLNCLQALQNPFLTAKYTGHEMDMLQALVDQQVDHVVRDQSKQILSRCGFEDKLETLCRVREEGGEAAPCSKIEGLDETSIGYTIHGFYNLMFQSGERVSPHPLPLVLLAFAHTHT